MSVLTRFARRKTNLAYHVLGQVKPGSTNFLYLQWDQPNHQFIFRLNNESPVYEPYTVSDTSPPFFAQKGIDWLVRSHTARVRLDLIRWSMLFRRRLCESVKDARQHSTPPVMEYFHCVG